MVRSVTNEEVAACLDMAATIDALEPAYRAVAEGGAVSIPRSDVRLPLGDGGVLSFKVMPGAIEPMDVAAIRITLDRRRWDGGRKRKEPTAPGGWFAYRTIVYDLEAGEPALLLPDWYASRMRVGGTSALGAEHMAPDARTVGLLGSGWQAGGQLLGFDAVLDLDAVRVYSPTRGHREGFADEWDGRLDADVRAVGSAREAAGGADVLACATSSMEPVFDADWIEPGSHVSAIKTPEVPPEAFDRADRVGVHTHRNPEGPHNYLPRGADLEGVEGAWDLGGFSIADGIELPDLVVEGRERDPGETTLFLNNMGTGVQWAAVGRAVLDRARAEGLGTEIDADLFLESPPE